VGAVVGRLLETVDDVVGGEDVDDAVDAELVDTGRAGGRGSDRGRRQRGQRQGQRRHSGQGSPASAPPGSAHTRILRREGTRSSGEGARPRRQDQPQKASTLSWFSPKIQDSVTLPSFMWATWV